MNDTLRTIAQKCLEGAEDNTLNFPEIIKMLTQNNFESYRINFLRNTATYYLADDTSIELSTSSFTTSVSKEFNADSIKSAIKEAQQMVEGYTYKGFWLVHSHGDAKTLTKLLTSPKLTKKDHSNIACLACDKSLKNIVQIMLDHTLLGSAFSYQK